MNTHSKWDDGNCIKQYIFSGIKSQTRLTLLTPVLKGKSNNNNAAAAVVKTQMRQMTFHQVHQLWWPSPLHHHPTQTNTHLCASHRWASHNADVIRVSADDDDDGSALCKLCSSIICLHPSSRISLGNLNPSQPFTLLNFAVQHANTMVVGQDSVCLKIGCNWPKNWIESPSSRRVAIR